jgi:hypothetical protein
MDAEGWVLISMLATFNRVKALSQDVDLIAKALCRSTELEVSGEHVRRRGDWFRWVMPTAKPSEVKRVSMNGVASEQGTERNGSTSPEEVKLESIPVWQGASVVLS